MWQEDHPDLLPAPAPGRAPEVEGFIGLDAEDPDAPPRYFIDTGNISILLLG